MWTNLKSAIKLTARRNLSTYVTKQSLKNTVIFGGTSPYCLPNSSRLSQVSFALATLTAPSTSSIVTSLHLKGPHVRYLSSVPHLAPHASAPQRLPRHNRGKRELDAFRFAENGEYVQTKFNLSSLKEVHARDLIAIDDSEIRRSGPVILPRKECIIVSISHVKAIILSDQLLLLDAHRPLVRVFAEYLRAHLKSTFPLRNQFRHTWSQGGGGASIGLVGLNEEANAADPHLSSLLLMNRSSNSGYDIGNGNGAENGISLHRDDYNDFMTSDMDPFNQEQDSDNLSEYNDTSSSGKVFSYDEKDPQLQYQGAYISTQDDLLSGSLSNGQETNNTASSIRTIPDNQLGKSQNMSSNIPAPDSSPGVTSSASTYSLTPAAAAAAAAASMPLGTLYPDALSTGTTAFEFRVLEGILRAVSDKYDRRLRCYAPVISTLLQELTAGTSVGSAIPRLLPLKNSLHSFERASDELLAVLTGLIHSNEDMLELFITEKKRRHGQLPPVEAHQECELLLETFHREFSQIRLEAQHLRKKIMATEDLVRITMDAYRNRMIMVQAYMAMLSTGVATGALVASVFGMNLRTGLEESPVAFYAVASSTVILAASVYILVYRQFLHQPRLKHIAVSGRAGTGEELVLLKAGMDDLGDIQDMLLQLTQNKLQVSRAEFKRFVREASGRTCPEHTLNLIFKLYGVRPRGGTIEDEFIPQDRMYQFLCDYPSARWTGRTSI